MKTFVCKECEAIISVDDDVMTGICPNCHTDWYFCEKCKTNYSDCSPNPTCPECGDTFYKNPPAYTHCPHCNLFIENADKIPAGTIVKCPNCHEEIELTNKPIGDFIK